MQSKNKIHYGWIIVASGVIMTACVMGVYSMTNSAFIIPICEELGFSRAEHSLHKTLITLLSAALLPLYSRLFERVPIRRMLLLCTAGLAAANLGYAISMKLWHFYVFAFIYGLFSNGFSFLIIGTLINRWFIGKKALATAIAYCGSGLGGALFMPIVSAVIDSFGWRMAYLCNALFVTVVLTLTVLFVVKARPEDMGLKPYEEVPPAKNQRNDRPARNDLPLEAGAGRNLCIAFVAVAFLSLSLSCCGPNTHTTAYLQDIGYTPMAAAAIMSVAMVMLTVGKLVLGILYDRFGTLVGNIVVGSCCALFPILALFADIPAIAQIYAFTLGMATSGYSVPVSVLVSKYFGSESFPKLFSICSLLTTLGGAASIPLMGLAFDVYGSYVLAWIVIAVLGVVGGLCVIFAELQYRAAKEK